jgi:class 3 adenylate cyclase
LIILEMVMLGLASLIGLGLSVIVSNRMMAGLERLIAGTRQVQDGHGYEVLPVTSDDEIGKLTVAFNLMVEDLRAKDRIKETFGKFVDPRIVANLIDPAGGKDLAERQVATVFFSDIKAFSGLGELLTATTLVKLLNTYFSEMTTLIHARNGIIDKFVGDGFPHRAGKGRTRPRLRDHGTCRIPFCCRERVARFVRRGAGGLSRPRLGPVGAAFRPVSGGDANGWASYRVPPPY